jgi:hypothetical protein
LFIGAGAALPTLASRDATDGAAFSAGDDGSVAMTVESSESSWEDGVIVTRLALHGVDAENQPLDVTVKALGGRVGDLVQVIGHVLPPAVGDSLRIKVGSDTAGAAIWMAPIAGH